jgi:transcriptional regulator with XRE-family HTH domain
MGARRTDRSKSNPPATEVGLALREARVRRKLGQGTVASLLGLKGPAASAQALVSNWEAGRAIIKVTPAQAAVLSQLLGISRESLSEKLAADEAARKAWRERKAGVCRDLPKAPAPAVKADSAASILPVIVAVLPRPASMRDVSSADLIKYIEDVLRVRAIAEAAGARP